MDYEDLARRLQAGQEQAFVDFANAFARGARARFIDAGLPPFEAEDLASWCMTDIPLRVHRYRVQEDGGFKAWVFKLLRNSWVDWKRRHGPPHEPLPDTLPVPADPEVSPRVAVVEAVQEALATLSGSDREIVELRNMGGERTFEEIAAMLGISVGAARVRHHRALRRLADLLRADPRTRAMQPDPAVR